MSEYSKRRWLDGALFSIASLLLLATSVTPRVANAQVKFTDEPFQTGFTPIRFLSRENFREHLLVDGEEKKRVLRHYCETLAKSFAKYGWDQDPCGTVDWQVDMTTANNHPLIYATFGEGEETTLLLGGVHPDEMTPIPIAFRFARHLQDHLELIGKKSRVIVAPLVNPDGFIRNVPSRANSNGVDLNRNFLTMDWYGKAKELWRARQRNPRHFPGYFPNSEVETIFQIKLIDQFAPDKILSIHAPLGFLDYDGPGDQKPVLISATEKKAKQLVHSISEKARNYRVVDYRFFPGSLGNYAGNERRVPTITLELETTEPSKVEAYWKQFLPGIIESIHYPFQIPESTANGNATRFSFEYQEGH